LEWDYFIEIGSDDLLKTEYLELIKGYLDRPLVGLDGLAFYDTESGVCRHYKTKHPFGAGRMIKRSVIERIGELWPDKINRGMDNNSLMKLITSGAPHTRMKTDSPMAIDLKSEVNIWSFNYFMGVPYEKDKAFEGLSIDEVEAIESLYVTA
jgi:hypothetical protein